MECLRTFGYILDIPISLLGVTILAWGNSIGDFFADRAVRHSPRKPRRAQAITESEPRALGASFGNGPRSHLLSAMTRPARLV